MMRFGELNHSDSDAEDISDDESVGTQCLPVEIPQNFDPNLPPQDGYDYLYRVHLEAQQCSKVAFAKPGTIPSNEGDSIELPVQNGESGAKKARLSVGDTFVKLDANRRIPEDVQRDQLEGFSQLKKKITRQRESIYPSTELHSSRKDTPDTPIILDTDKPPEFANLLTLSQADVCHNLELLAGEMIANGRIKGSWLYSLLAVLQEPLDSSIYASLRQISRICSHIRSQTNCEPDSWTACNLIILLIGNYYEQKDLRD